MIALLYSGFAFGLVWKVLKVLQSKGGRYFVGFPPQARILLGQHKKRKYTCHLQQPLP
jgi:hypothetical protein